MCVRGFEAGETCQLMKVSSRMSAKTSTAAATATPTTSATAVPDSDPSPSATAKQSSTPRPHIILCTKKRAQNVTHALHLCINTAFGKLNWFSCNCYKNTMSRLITMKLDYML